MECCNTKEKERYCGDIGHNKDHKQMKGGKIKMERRIVLWSVIGILFIVALFLVFKAGSAQSVSAIASTGGSITQPASSAAASSGMVGGC